MGKVISTAARRETRHWHHQGRTEAELANWARYCSRSREEWRDVEDEAKMWSYYKRQPARGDR
jgi:hypothetical protein